MVRVVHLNNGGRYQETLCRALAGAGIEALLPHTWGKHLPEAVPEIALLAPDVIHLHWPESLTGFDKAKTPALLPELRAALAALAEVAPIVHTLHNLVPHSRTNLDLWQPWFQDVIDAATAIVHHSECGRERAHAAYRIRGMETVIPHGIIQPDLPVPPTREEARRHLNLPRDKRIFWIFGGIRQDKNVLPVLHWIRDRAPRDTHFLVSGRIHPAEPEGGAAYREAMAGVDAIDFRDGPVPDEEAAWQGHAVDCLIQNYGAEHLTSGGPHLSQALGVPQICVENPYCREILGRAAIYLDPGRPLGEELDRAVAACTPARLDEARILLRRQKPHFEWSALAPRYLDLYQQVR